MTATEKVYKFDYTDVLFWLSFMIFVVWLIAKILGLI